MHQTNAMPFECFQPHPRVNCKAQKRILGGTQSSQNGRTKKIDRLLIHSPGEWRTWKETLNFWTFLCAASFLLHEPCFCRVAWNTLITHISCLSHFLSLFFFPGLVWNSLHRLCPLWPGVFSTTALFPPTSSAVEYTILPLPPPIFFFCIVTRGDDIFLDFPTTSSVVDLGSLKHENNKKRSQRRRVGLARWAEGGELLPTQVPPARRRQH